MICREKSDGGACDRPLFVLKYRKLHVFLRMIVFTLR
ncbi:hypothetical protein Desti_5061 [Desulfomonile tiedjei DSM 6799]|uniref:Uncharacterized protein n=1 Tax=Desulfomonile tiedjei (strain ATCC 49306 / DSM 6799 / DCB-1) TaxID=706587 RepID=I4CDN0_DESTA|nr:hypothetical protein Desti_5061 [Desulfomonile tiedjei DSM 6799]